MQKNFKKTRPPVPDTWGSLNASPTRSYELMNEDQIFIPDRKRIITKASTSSSKNVSPTEEYLEMTKRLIESNSLPARTTLILQDLYTRYKAISDPLIGDRSTKISWKEYTTDNVERCSSYENVSLISLQEIYTAGQQQRQPSISTRYEELKYSLSLYKSHKQSQPELETKPGTSAEESYQNLSDFSLEDPNFERECNPQSFKIDSVFSDFSLRDVGHDKTLLKHIRKWIDSNRQE